MISIFSPKDLTRPVPFEQVSILDIQLFQSTSSEVVLYVEGDRFKILKHWMPEYNKSELPYTSLRPIIMSAIHHPNMPPKRHINHG